jgi:hypothetical protein
MFCIGGLTRFQRSEFGTVALAPAVLTTSEDLKERKEVLVSAIMIAQTLDHTWSELLTSVWWSKQMLDCRNAETQCLSAM